MSEAELADRAERRLQVLEHLAERGMALVQLEAKRLMAKVAVTNPKDPGFADLGSTFTELARAVHETLALAAVLEAKEAKRKARAQSEPQAAPRQPALLSAALQQEGKRREREARSAAAAAAVADWEARKDRIREGIETTIRARAGTRAALQLLVSLDARLDSLGEAAASDTRPLAQIAADICTDLGIEPDFSIWTDEELGFSTVAPQDGSQGSADPLPPAEEPLADTARRRVQGEAEPAAEERRRRPTSRLN